MDLSTPYTPPTYHVQAFNCPFCNAFSHQEWSDALISGAVHYEPIADLEVAHCSNCVQFSLWHKKAMIYPITGGAPMPSSDLPSDIKNDYEEARSISSLSPRGAAALLRLAMQKLCEHLGEGGEDLNTAIGNLVKKGLSEKIQKALDSVRVIGNEAVHPGEMDLRDDAKTVADLFVLVNLITDAMITQPRRIDEIFEKLPDTKKDQIRKRDSRS